MILTYTILDRKGRILISAIEHVENKEQADELITRAIQKLTACEWILDELSLTEESCQTSTNTQ